MYFKLNRLFLLFIVSTCSLFADVMVQKGAIQVGAFSKQANIDRRVALLKDFHVHKQNVDNVTKLYILTSKEHNANELLAKLQSRVPGAFLTQATIMQKEKKTFIKAIHIGSFTNQNDLEKSEKTYQYFTLYKENKDDTTELYILSNDIQTTLEKIKFFKPDAKTTMIAIQKK